MKQSVPFVLVMLGVALVVLSFLWAILFPASNNWTDDKSARMATLTREVHALLFQVEGAKQRRSMTAGPNPAELQAEYDAKKAELAALRTEFETQRDAPQTTSKILRWTGIALVLVGGGAVMAQREA
jgi:hypothetical protein